MNVTRGAAGDQWLASTSPAGVLSTPTATAAEVQKARPEEDSRWARQIHQRGGRDFRFDVPGFAKGKDTSRDLSAHLRSVAR